MKVGDGETWRGQREKDHELRGKIFRDEFKTFGLEPKEPSLVLMLLHTLFRLYAHEISYFRGILLS